MKITIHYKDGRKVELTSTFTQVDPLLIGFDGYVHEVVGNNGVIGLHEISYITIEDDKQ